MCCVIKCISSEGVLAGNIFEVLKSLKNYNKLKNIYNPIKVWSFFKNENYE